MEKLEIVRDYYVNGTDFEIINCPAYDCRNCKVYCTLCYNNKDCIIKSHTVALSALVDVAKRAPRSAEHIGAMACFNSFIIQR